MLKLVDPGGDETGAAALLAALDGHAGVRLVAASGHALLMERVLPGGPTLDRLALDRLALDRMALDRMALDGQDDAATGILCDLIGAQQVALRGVDLPGLIPLQDRPRTLTAAVARGQVPLAVRPLMQRAAGCVTEMTAPARQVRQPLHGDMHHCNA